MNKELENSWAVQEIWQDKCYKLEEENRKLKAHCNMLESENRLLKEECKARLEKIKELETDYDRLKVAFEDVVSGK